MAIIQIPGVRNKWISAGSPGVVKPKNILPIRGLVVHHTGTFSEQSTIDWFTDPRNTQASAHYLIGTEGKVYQFVKESERAWHAGVSQLVINGVLYQSWNKFTLSYELTGNGNVRPYTSAQYFALESLLREAVEKYSVTVQWLVGHEQLAPGRKDDPGRFFDWPGVREAAFGW